MTLSWFITPLLLGALTSPVAAESASPVCMSPEYVSEALDLVSVHSTPLPKPYTAEVYMLNANKYMVLNFNDGCLDTSRMPLIIDEMDLKNQAGIWVIND